jgi:hypothetical protein
MCYGYGLRNEELNNSTAQFVSLFLQGNSEREAQAIRAGWEQARLVASSMSKGASKIKFEWERPSIGKVDIPEEIWDKFTFDTDGRKMTAEDVVKFKLNGIRKNNL